MLNLYPKIMKRNLKDLKSPWKMMDLIIEKWRIEDCWIVGHISAILGMIHQSDFTFV